MHLLLTRLHADLFTLKEVYAIVTKMFVEIDCLLKSTDSNVTYNKCILALITV